MPNLTLSYNYGLKYQCNFVTVKNSLPCAVKFYYMDYSGPVTQITGGKEPFSLAYNTGNENKVCGIIGSQATIKIQGSEHLTTENFISPNSDYDIKVTLEISGVVNWTGFVVPDDVYAPWFSISELTIIASDNLGLLKNKELIDGNQNKFNDFYAVIDYIMGCLYWTGVRIPVNTYVNIFESWDYPLGAPAAQYGDRTVNPLNDPFSSTYYDSRSFEGDNSIYYKMYDVLNSILLDWGCALFQAEGEFHIMRQPERIKDGIAGTKYTWVGTQGVYLYSASTTVVANYDGEIGLAKAVQFHSRSQTKGLIRQVAFTRQQYNYVNVPNVIKNSNFTDTDGSYLRKDSYTGGYSTYTGIVLHWKPVGRTIYTKTDYDTNNNIKLQYLTMIGEPDSFFNPSKFVESDPITVLINDKISFSIDVATRSNVGSDHPFAFQILITDPTGVIRYLRKDAEWTSSNVLLNVSPGSDSTQWVTYSIESNNMVIGGKLVVRLFLQQSCVPPNETWFKGLKLTYEPQDGLGKDSKPLKGYAYKIAQLGSPGFAVKKTIDRVVTTSTKSKPALRGCLFGAHDAGTDYKTALHMRHNGTLEKLDFVEINAIDEFNGYARTMSRVEGQCYGIYYPVLGQTFSRIVSPATRFKINPMLNKFYMALGHMEIMFKSESFQAVFIELTDSTSTPPDGTNQGDTILADRFKFLY